MTGYRLCFANTEDRRVPPIELDCANDAAVMIRAAELADGRAVDVWHFDRVVGRQGPTKPAPAPRGRPPSA